MNLSIKRLESGYWHIRAPGICNWTQPPSWPCSEAVIRAHAFQEASEMFLRQTVHEARRISIYDAMANHELQEG